MATLAFFCLIASIPVVVYFVVATIAGLISWGCYWIVVALGFLGIALLSMSGGGSDWLGAFFAGAIFIGYFGASGAAALCVWRSNRRSNPQVSS